MIKMASKMTCLASGLRGASEVLFGEECIINRMASQVGGDVLASAGKSFRVFRRSAPGPAVELTS